MQKLRYKNIVAEFYDTHTSKLVILMPGTGYQPGLYTNVAQELQKDSSVLLIEQGYFGLPTTQKYSHYSSSQAVKSLAELIASLPHPKKYVIASSVGVVTALKLLLHSPDLIDHAFLVSIPFIRKNYNRFLDVLLSISLFLSPAVCVKIFYAVSWINPNLRQLDLLIRPAFINCGEKSCFLGLKEITRFTFSLHKNKQLNQAKITALMGNKDPVFMAFGDSQLIKNNITKDLQILAGPHNLVVSSWEKIYPIFRHYSQQNSDTPSLGGQ